MGTFANLAEWRGHLLTQLQHRAQALSGPQLRELRDELLAYPGRRPGTLTVQH
jgi:hypothetical protein